MMAEQGREHQIEDRGPLINHCGVRSRPRRRKGRCEMSPSIPHPLSRASRYFSEKFTLGHEDPAHNALRTLRWFENEDEPPLQS